MFLRWMILVLLHQYMHAFNLDLRYPFVYESESPGDYFGFSVSLHPGSQIPEDYSWMMVGAPRGNQTDEYYQPGRVLQCYTGFPCKLLQLDVIVNSYPLVERYDNAMLGASQDMLNGRFVSCAPRWMGRHFVQRQEEMTMVGLAYWGKSKDIEVEQRAEKIAPLDVPGKYFEFWPTATGGNARFSIYEYGEAGFSSHLTSSQGLQEMVLGAPSAYNWRGSAILYRDTDYSEGLARRKRSVGAGDFASQIIIDAFKGSTLKAFGLFGYAITSGRFFKETQLIHVAGAPRSNSVGSVLLYVFNERAKEKLIPIDELSGTHVGEYFGSALATCDIDADGYDDLIVGAPLYTQSMDEGRVLIYLGGYKDKLTPAEKNGDIIGSVPKGRFGSTISCTDLDLDGYSDVIIASPYEGNGVVYVYNGSPGGVSDRIPQRIAGSDIHPQIRGFGFSISRGQDMDGNKYKDIAIGAYKSGHAVLLRSRPVVQFEVNLNPEIQDRLNRNSTQVTVQACVKYVGHNLPEKIDVIQILELDPALRRLTYNDREATVNEATYTLRKTLFLKTDLNYDFNCFLIPLNMKPNNKRFFEPLEIAIEYRTIPDDNKKIPIIFRGSHKIDVKDEFCALCPVMLPNTRAHASTRIKFATLCGDDDICNSQLATHVEFVDLPSQGFILGSSSVAKIRVSVTNAPTADPAYLTSVEIFMPVRANRLPIQCQEATKENITDTSSKIICELANPLEKGMTRSVDLELDMSEASARQGEMRVSARASTTSQLHDSEDIETSAVLGLQTHADVTVYGIQTDKDFFLYDPKENEGKVLKKKIPFNLRYQIEKFGPSPVDLVELTVKIPIALKSGERFVHLAQPLVFTLNNRLMKCIPDSQLQADQEAPPSNLKTAQQRKRRYVEENKVMNVTMVVNNEDLYPANRTLYVNCTHSTNWVCAELKCTAGRFVNLQSVGKLELNLVLSTPGIAPLLGTQDIILFGTEASVKILDPPDVQQPINVTKKPDTADVTAAFRGRPAEGRVEAWVIAVSVIAGILLLIAIIVGLVKAGFFVRKDKDALNQRKLESQAADNPTPVADE